MAIRDLAMKAGKDVQRVRDETDRRACNEDLEKAVKQLEDMVAPHTLECERRIVFTSYNDILMPTLTAEVLTDGLRFGWCSEGYSSRRLHLVMVCEDCQAEIARPVSSLEDIYRHLNNWETNKCGHICEADRMPECPMSFNQSEAEVRCFKECPWYMTGGCAVMLLANALYT